MAFYPYPPNLPVEEGKYLAPLLRGTVPDDIPKAIQAGWVVAGYAASVFVPASPPIGILSEMQVADYLETLGDAKAAAAVPWDLILPIITNFILELLKRRAGS